MIRKPDTHEFRESDAVLAVRDAGTVAREGARGILDGTAHFLGRGLAVLLGLGFLLTLTRHLGPLAILVASAGGLALFLRRGRGEVMAAAFAPGAGVEGHDLSVGAVARAAAKSGVIAILCFPTRPYFYMLPFAAAGITSLTITMLLLARLAGDRTALRFDASSIIAHGLLGPTTLMWSDVNDIAVSRASFFNLKVRFASGSRYNLVVSGSRNRFGGPNVIYLPVNLLGLDGAALARLVSRLCQLQEVGEPRSLVNPALIVGKPHGERAMATADFDPDAIMARYMDDRRKLVAIHEKPSPSPVRTSFGRKVS